MAREGGVGVGVGKDRLLEDFNEAVPGSGLLPLPVSG
jgi:hypothetical protein